MSKKDKKPDVDEVTALPVDEVPEPENAPSGVADLDSITESLVSASPEPNTAAIEASGQKEERIKEAYADLRDSRGNRFDPEIHVTDENGEPKLTMKGKLRMRPGRKSKVAGADKAAIGGALPTREGMTHQQKMQARMTGDAAASALITLGVVVGGDEWNPITDAETGIDEKANLSHAFGDYFEAKEMTDIPPGVALTIAISAYVIPRFTMPKTKTRVQRFKEWIATKIAQRKMRKNSGPQSDTRNDGKRQDDTREGTRETIENV